jgi:excisionase family DNA binding protein
VSSEPLPGFLRPDQVCERLGTSPSSLSRWMREGRVPFYRIGRSIFVPERWLRYVEMAALGEADAGSDEKGGADQ